MQRETFLHVSCLSQCPRLIISVCTPCRRHRLLVSVYAPYHFVLVREFSFHISLTDLCPYSLHLFRILSQFLSFPLLLSLNSFPSSFLARRELARSRPFLIAITSTDHVCCRWNEFTPSRLKISSIIPEYGRRSSDSFVRENIASTFGLVILRFGLHHLALGILGERDDEF